MGNTMTLIAIGLCSMVVTVALTWAWIRIAPRFGFIDYPGGRHDHHEPTPTGGGIAFFTGVWVTAMVFGAVHNSVEFIGLLIASGLLVALNLYDDRYGLSAWGRLLVQIIIGIVVYQWGIRVEGVGNLFGWFGEGSWISLGWLSAPVTVLWLVLVTNALNWLDGIDGVAAGVGGISAATLAVMAALSNEGTMFAGVAILGAALAGACLGFLRYNFSPAKVFMGDTGAMFIGLMLGALSAQGAFKRPAAIAVFLPVLVLGVPLYDSATSILARVLSGRNPLAPDRNHLHHRLTNRGYSAAQTALLIYGMTAILCLSALWLWWQ